MDCGHSRCACSYVCFREQSKQPDGRVEPLGRALLVLQPSTPSGMSPAAAEAGETVRGREYQRVVVPQIVKRLKGEVR